MMQHMDSIRGLLDLIVHNRGLNTRLDNVVAVYGEWCGQGIQKGVAISALTKMFVIFSINVNGNWIDGKTLPSMKFEGAGIYDINDFTNYECLIDFEQPELAQAWLAAITENVENECPVGATFGVIGVGEGVVWRCADSGYNSSEYWFKVKGEKHSATKVKTLAAVDVDSIKLVTDFVSAAVTENRLEQGLKNIVNEQKKTFEMGSIGDFIRWVYNDIIKEESDVIEQNLIDKKK